ncbi:MAG: hypothetical protein N3A53_04895, partial [Verrucomicrobiae bacterium]|nr:hypothetical protein [Verrucomicrobiae bacterium]
EDPEKLEEEFGDLGTDETGEEDEFGSPPDAGSETTEETKTRRLLRRLRRRRPPQRDEKLYDMADYV